MNGGTNVALAIQTASKHMLNSLPETGSRTLILLTDGRIDHYQGTSSLLTHDLKLLSYSLSSAA